MVACFPCPALPCFALPCLLALAWLALAWLALAWLALAWLARLPCLALPCLARSLALAWLGLLACLLARLPWLALPCLALAWLGLLPCLLAWFWFRVQPIKFLVTFAQRFPGRCGEPVRPGTYSLISSSPREMLLSRRTGDGKYTDKMAMTLAPAGDKCASQQTWVGLLLGPCTMASVVLWASF